ncbi:hypothetical protein [Arcticibacter tournemirensis]
MKTLLLLFLLHLKILFTSVTVPGPKDITYDGPVKEFKIVNSESLRLHWNKLSERGARFVVTKKNSI